MIIEENILLDDLISISDNKIILNEKNPFSKYLIYKENDNVIGFIYYYEIYEKIEISYIFVKEGFRNKKIASKLLEYLIDKNINKDNITLEVRIDNYIAIKLYEKFGFKRVAIRKKYYNDMDGILMEKVMN